MNLMSRPPVDRSRLLSWQNALIPCVTLLLGITSGWAQVELEYVGHACFLLRSPGGVQVVIDPFNGERWLGYHFPEDVPADAVLISHPHYDHDAAYYFDASVPVLRRPGGFHLGDVKITGVKGSHAQPYGADFGRSNVIWLLETGGLRLAHWGDNGPLTKDLKGQLGDLDIVLIPMDSTYHILKREAVENILEAFAPVVAIPMHYRLDLAPEMDDLGPISPLLKEPGARQADSHRASFSKEALPARNEVLALRPWPSLRRWEDSLQQAWMEAAQARRAAASGNPDGPAQAFRHVQRSVELAPGVLVFQWGLAQALAHAGQKEQAIRTLEEALAAGLQDDWEYRMRSHLLLAQLYEQGGNLARAADHYRILARGSFRPAMLEAARRFLAR